MKRGLLHRLPAVSAVPAVPAARAAPGSLDVGSVAVSLSERPAESVLSAWDRLVAETKES
ncbi:MAG: hypothetical protein QOD04_323, partial [Pseudonocardiales bacterium]|nr:hypothetical protein [Pseudonocardiales bacterium]